MVVELGELMMMKVEVVGVVWMWFWCLCIFELWELFFGALMEILLWVLERLMVYLGKCLCGCLGERVEGLLG